MDCAGFADWLDQGMPEATAVAAHAHAAACVRCAAALERARVIDAALARYAATAPAGFTGRVMESVARARLTRLAAWVEPDLLPWWVRAAAEPATALSLGLGALVAWQYPLLARLVATASQALAGPAVADFLQRLAAPRFTLDLALLADPYVVAGFVLAGLPLAWWAGLAVYHWSGDPRPVGAARR